MAETATFNDKKVSFYVIGPSSTGKTTLCEALAKRLGIPDEAFVKEVARTVMKEKGYSRDTVGSLNMQKDIMEAHSLREEALDTSGHQVSVCDRSSVDPIVYAILTAKNPDEAAKRQKILTEFTFFHQGLSRYKAKGSVIILLKPVAGWLVDDGVRSIEDQEKCCEIFKKLLSDCELRYFEVGEEMKFLDERVNFAMGLGKM